MQIRLVLDGNANSLGFGQDYSSTTGNDSYNNSDGNVNINQTNNSSNVDMNQKNNRSSSNKKILGESYCKDGSLCRQGICSNGSRCSIRQTDKMRAKDTGISLKDYKRIENATICLENKKCQRQFLRSFDEEKTLFDIISFAYIKSYPKLITLE